MAYSLIYPDKTGRGACSTTAACHGWRAGAPACPTPDTAAEAEGCLPAAGREGDIVFLLHNVTAGDKQFVLHRLHGQAVGFIRLLGLQSRQGLAAAGQGGLRRGCDQIAAVRTDIKFRAFHISSRMCIGIQLPGHEAVQADAQSLRQRRKQGYVGTSGAPLPF